MQAANHEKRLFFAQLETLARQLLRALLERGIEPVLKALLGLEDLGKKEIEKGPELGQVVLKRRSYPAVLAECNKKLIMRTGKQESMLGSILGCKDLRELCTLALDAVTFINNDVRPLDLAEDGHVAHHKLVRRQKDREIATTDEVLVEMLAVRL